MEKLSGFLQWSIDKGAYVDDSLKFEIRDKKGITAIALQNAVKNKPVIRVPKSILIMQENALKEFGIQEWNSKYTNGITKLLLAKLKFQNESHEFQPYLDLLPEIPDQPIFWHPDELGLLQGTDFILMLKNKLAGLLEEYQATLNILNIQIPEDETSITASKSSITFDYIHSRLNELESFSKDTWKSFIAFLWADAVFNARAFPQILIDNGDTKDLNQAFLLPIVDLLNHSSSAKVRWNYDSNAKEVTFTTLEKLKAGNEIFNNYGEKTSDELLYGYGFLTKENNSYDSTKLTLKLDPDIIHSALAIKILTSDNVINENCVYFLLSYHRPLPESLINFFGYLSKLNSEKGSTYRSMLEGLEQLRSILEQKIEFYQTSSKIDPTKPNLRAFIIGTVKIYLNNQKKLYQVVIEKLQQLQKRILTKEIPNESLVSFKNIFKGDNLFANSMLLSLGVTNYEGLLTKNCQQDALLLWLVKNNNALHYDEKKHVPSFINEMFEEVSRSIVIERQDVLEYMDLYKKYFPKLSEKIPEVYGKGDWGIRQLIVADTVIDRLVYIRKANSEPFFIKRTDYHIR